MEELTEINEIYWNYMIDTYQHILSTAEKLIFFLKNLSDINVMWLINADYLSPSNSSINALQVKQEQE